MSFESNLVTELCQLPATEKLRTTPNHPQMNCQCERFDSTLIRILGTLPEQGKSHWKDQVASLVHAYNCTRSTATDLSPCFLMFSRHQRLALDVAFGVIFADMQSVNTEKYVDKSKSHLKWAYKVTC